MWHTQTGSQVLSHFHTSRDTGLTNSQVSGGQDQYGPNTLALAPSRSLFSLFIDQFKDFMIITLLLAAAISFAAAFFTKQGDYIDPFIILAILIMNACFGVYQELRAHQALKALDTLQTPHCQVIREGKKQSLLSSLLVPGDLVCLSLGDLVPADGRLLQCEKLTANESALTGESDPVTKQPHVLPQEALPLGDRTNMVYAGTLITAGHGLFCVTETGMNTQVGQIAHVLSHESAPDTPLTRHLNRMGITLGLIALGICVLLFFLGLHKGYGVLSMFLTAVSLGVAAIPESLPALVTIMLSLGVEKMAKRNAIIRHLPAVETLGSATLICSDKTGTLTQNQMSVEEYESSLSPKDLSSLLCLCSHDSGATETALKHFSMEQKISADTLRQEYPILEEMPFDSLRRQMTTVHPCRSGYLVISKGAPEKILSSCHSIYMEGSTVPLSLSLEKKIRQTVHDYAGKAYRVLAVAYGIFSSQPATPEKNLVFAGLVGLIDPPRKEAAAAVASCRRAGIRAVMITGDHPDTALSIASKVGICHQASQLLRGDELDRLTDAELLSRLDHTHVFARVTPFHKVRLVRLFQSKGHIVAMTGDGVNDAPALKAADIGCAMGRSGTDVAREASDLILMDDNFSTIVSAIELGRGIFDNIKKAVHFLLSCNIGEIMTLFFAMLLGYKVPLLPVQLLFVNLVTDSFPALCLGMEPPEPDVMSSPGKSRHHAIFSFSSLFEIVTQGMFLGSLALTAYLIGGSTMCFAVLSLSQLVHSFNLRSHHSLLETGLFGNKKLVLSFLLCAALQCLVVAFAPLQSIFHTQSLSGIQWAIVWLLSLLPVVLVELQKYFNRDLL